MTVVLVMYVGSYVVTFLVILTVGSDVETGYSTATNFSFSTVKSEVSVLIGTCDVEPRSP